MWNTVRYVAYFAVPDVIIALFLALLLNQRIRWKGFFRTAFFAPVVTSTVATAVIWRYLYQPNFGLFSQILRLFGLPKVTVLIDPKTAMLGVAAYSVWKSVGYNMIIFLAGLQGIPTVFYEAARIDGASRYHIFRHITLPLLQPTTLFVTVITMIGSFQVFTQIFIMTSGGPLRSTLPIVQHIYYVAFQGHGFDAGYASAISMLLFLILMILTLFQLRIGRAKWDY
jgi:multiple sugar transport system permease protein